MNGAVGDHKPMWVTNRRGGSKWHCTCGAEGAGISDPSVGWAEHIRSVRDDAKKESSGA